MNRKKVVHVIWSAALGGIERVVYALLCEQVENKVLEPALLIAKHSGPMPQHFIDLNIEIQIAGFASGSDFSEQPKLICKELFDEADIIHFHSFNPIIAGLARKSGSKIIYTEHGNFGFSRKRSLSEKLSAFFLKRFLNNRVAIVTFNSEFSLSVALQRYGLKKVRKEVVYNGCPSLPDPLPHHTFHEFQIGLLKVVTVGRLVQVKKIERLLRAFSGAANARLQLIITGDGPMRHELEQLCIDCGIQDQVVFTGAQSSIAVMQYADLCVFPSQFEAFGLVAVEAWQLGKPVAVFHDGGGLTELTNSIEPELVMQSEQELAELLGALTERITVLHSKEREMKRKSFAARFTIGNMALRFNELYNSL